MYECQLIFKWCSWSSSIIIHVMDLQFGGCCNAHHYFALPCYYLTQRLSFAIGKKLSQSDWRSTCMSTNLFLNGVAGQYWSLSMSWIHNLAVAGMPTTVLHLLLPIWTWGYHLPLVKNWVRVTKGSSMQRTKFWGDSAFPEFGHGNRMVYRRIILYYSYTAIALLFISVPPCPDGILIILHVLYSKRDHYCNAHHCWTITAMPTTVFLLLAPSWRWGHYLSLVMCGVKMSEVAHVWLQAVQGIQEFFASKCHVRESSYLNKLWAICDVQ
jgi:hypothetical protein